MANKVITFYQDPIQKKLQENPYEVFLDIDMLAVPKPLSVHWDEYIYPEISDYYTALKVEDADATIITDPRVDQANLILFTTDEYNKPEIVKHVSVDYSASVISRLVNVNAIRNSLNNIFTWTPGERVLLPEFGSNLRKLLYEGITNFNVEQVIAEIKHSVSKWEPRVQVVNIVDVSTTDDHENNTIHIKVIYVIPGLSDQQFEYDYVQPITRH